MAKSNCLFFYLALRRRQLRKGRRGMLVVRKSLHGWFPHFLYQYRQPKGGHRMVSFVPTDPVNDLLLPPIKFEGRVKWGDGQH